MLGAHKVKHRLNKPRHDKLETALVDVRTEMQLIEPRIMCLCCSNKQRSSHSQQHLRTSSARTMDAIRIPKVFTSQF